MTQQLQQLRPEQYTAGAYRIVPEAHKWIGQRMNASRNGRRLYGDVVAVADAYSDVTGTPLAWTWVTLRLVDSGEVIQREPRELSIVLD